MFYWDPTYLAIMLLGMVLGVGTQAYISSSFKKWSKVSMTNGMTGAQAARTMLDREGLTQVTIERVSGSLTDHFDPRSNVLRLSEEVYSGTSVSSTAVACHEAGHAVQHARGYVPAKLRGALVPVVNIGTQMWGILLIMGILFQSTQLFTAAIVCFGFAVIFQVVTLPVEFNASARALTNIESYAAAPGTQEHAGAKTVLRAAALTYVAAALISILQLLYYIGLRDRR